MTTSTSENAQSPKKKDEQLVNGPQMSREANLMRRALLEDYKANRVSFEDILSYAVTQKPISRMQMTKVLRAHGWKKQQFMIAVNVLELPVNNRLEWWIRDKNAEVLAKLRDFMASGAVRAQLPERFPWSDI